MNPFKSLVGFFIALILTMPAAPLRGAEDDWATVRVGKRLEFYILKSNLEKLKASKTADMRPLYSKKREYRKTAALEKDDKARYWIHYKGTGYRISPTILGLPQPAAERKQADASRSEQDREIFDLVSKSGLNESQKTRAMGILRGLKANNKELYAKVLAMSPARRDAFLALPPEELEKIIKGKPDEAEAKLAAILAQAEALGHKGHQNPDVELPEGKITMEDGEIKGLNILKDLTRLIAAKNTVIINNIAGRFERFILEEKKGDSGYVAASIEESMLKRVKTYPKGWIEAQPPGRVAALYYVMGDPGVLKIQEPVEMRKALQAGLDACLMIYTKQEVKAKEHCPGRAHDSHPGQYTGSSGQKGGPSANNDFNPWWGAFFEHAAKTAENIISDPRVIKKIMEEIAATQQPGNKLPGDKAKEDELREKLKNMTVQGYSFADLYINGAEVRWVPWPGHKDEKGNQLGRWISVKIYTKLINNRPVDEIGIFDISDPMKNPDADPSSWRISGKRYSLNTKEISFSHWKDGPQYKLKMDVDGSVKLENIKNKEKADDNRIITSKKDLYRMRREQAELAPQVEINGRHFRALGQGGGRGSVLLMAADKDGKLIGVGKTPELMYDVAELTGGMVQLLTEPQPVGFVGRNKDGKPAFYWTKWNDDEKAVDYQECNDKDEKIKCGWPEPKAEKKPETAPPGTKPNPGEGGSGGGSGGGSKEEGWSARMDACNLPENLNLEGAVSKYPRKEKWPWHAVTPTGDKEAANNTYLCLHGKGILGFRGVITKEGISVVDEKYLVIDTVIPKNFIEPQDLDDNGVANLDPKKPEFVNGERRTKLIEARQYIIPLDGLDKKLESLLKKKGPLPHAERVAWIKRNLDLGQGDKQVFYPKVDVYIKNMPSVKMALDLAVKTFSKESPLFKDEGKRKKINEYIAYLDKEAASGGITGDQPTVVIHFFPHTDNELNDEKIYRTVISASSWLKTKDKAYELVYCPNSNKKRLEYINEIKKWEECNKEKEPAGR